MNIYRVYTQLDDFGGWHTALYYDKDSATKYFNTIRKKHPDGYVITETLDDDTGRVLSRKEFNKTVDVGLDEVKAMRQEYVNLIRYDIKWKEKAVERESVSPNEASAEMIAAVGSEGYGVSWIYIVEPCCFVKHVNFAVTT